MRPVLVVAFVFLAAYVWAQPSQPPIPGKSPTGGDKQQSASEIQSSPASNQTPAAPAQPATDPSTSVINQFAESQTADDPNNESSGYNWAAISALFSLGVGLLQFYVMKRQADISELQRQLINTQTTHMESGLNAARDSATAAANSAKAAADTLATNKAIERAYLKMAHNRPGIVFESNEEFSRKEDKLLRNISVSIAIRNKGNTPATVTEIGLKLVNEDPLPANPDYSNCITFRLDAFLVRNSPMATWLNFSVLSSVVDEMKRGARPLYVIGYVDYIDSFGQRLRAGYARGFLPGVDEKSAYTSDDGKFSPKQYKRRNNLGFVKALRYNYDRERHPGEGSDWPSQEAKS